MDKYVTRSRSPSPIRNPNPIYLGILGSRNDMNMEEIHDKLLEPLIRAFEKVPEKIIIPNEGSSNIYIAGWAEEKEIPTESYFADWKRDGKRARILRDSRIIKEATHLVCFNGPRSQYYETLGTKHVKNKEVFVVSSDKEVVQLSTT